MKIQNYLYALLLFVLLPTANAQRVLSLTVEDVGAGGQDAYVPILDGFSGKFSFGELLKKDTYADPLPGGYYLGPSLAFTTDLKEITTDGPVTDFSSGFLFAFKTFIPKVAGPINMDVSTVNGKPVLTLDDLVDPNSSLPWAGDYYTNGLAEPPVYYVLGPQTFEQAIFLPPGSINTNCDEGLIAPLTKHRDFTVRWINQIGNTDQYNYKIVWTHCINEAEDPELSFVGSSASWILEGVMTVEPTSPTVVGTSPLHTATGVPTNAKISVVFDEVMDPGTVTGGGFTVNPGNVCSGNITTVDNIVFECDPGGLVPSTFFTVTLNTSATDSNSTALESDVVTSFTTGTVADVTAPTIMAIAPADGTSAVSVADAVSITFADASVMGAKTLRSISLSQGATSVGGTVTTADNLTFIFTPYVSLTFNTTYTVTVDSGDAVDVSGNLLVADSITSFSTGAATSLVEPDTGTRITIDNSGASLVEVGNISQAQAGGTPPDRIEFGDLITYTINGVTDQVVVTIEFPEDLTGKIIYKVMNGNYTLLTEGTDYALLDNFTLQMTMVDNGPMDSDPTIGIIVDPIAVATDLEALPTASSLGGGFGCSVANHDVSVLDRADMLLLFGLLMVAGMLRKKART